MAKSFPTQEEMQALPINKINVYNERAERMVAKEVPDWDKLDRETVGNIILNVLAQHKDRDKKDGFYSNMIANSVLTAEKEKPFELKDKLKKYLIDVLDEATLRVEQTKNENGNGPEVTIGVYSGYAIAQVKEELGITFDVD